ncbi:hypothetical protein DFP72DRAFT_877143, partial [Ephemerocybe angulata]
MWEFWPLLLVRSSGQCVALHSIGWRLYSGLILGRTERRYQRTSILFTATRWTGCFQGAVNTMSWDYLETTSRLEWVVATVRCHHTSVPMRCCCCTLAMYSSVPLQVHMHSNCDCFTSHGSTSPKPTFASLPKVSQLMIALYLIQRRFGEDKPSLGVFHT